MKRDLIKLRKRRIFKIKTKIKSTNLAVMTERGKAPQISMFPVGKMRREETLRSGIQSVWIQRKRGHVGKESGQFSQRRER